MSSRLAPIRGEISTSTSAGSSPGPGRRVCDPPNIDWNSLIPALLGGLILPVAVAAVEAMSFPAALAVEPRSATLLAGDRARTLAVEI